MKVIGKSKKNTHAVLAHTEKKIHEHVAAYLKTSEIKRQNLKNLMLRNCYFDIIAVKEIIICFWH